MSDQDSTPPPSSPSFDPASLTGGTLESPPYGSGRLSAADDKLYCTLAHLFSVIIWLWKKDESPAVNVHGKVALNFHLTIFIAVLVLAVLSRIPILGCILSIVSMLISVGALILSIIGALKANDGKLFKYPFTFNLIK